MRSLIIFALAIVGINTEPVSRLSEIDWHQERFVTDTIASIIEDLTHDIRDNGFDPLHIVQDSGVYELPVPVIFTAGGDVTELLALGLSDIVIDHMHFSLLGSRLELTLVLPSISLSLQKADGHVVFFGNDIKASAAGSFSITNIRIPVVADLWIGIISGIGVTGLDLDISIGQIRSNLNIELQGVNYSRQINKFLSSSVPDTFNDLRAEINELLEIVLLPIINDLLF